MVGSSVAAREPFERDELLATKLAVPRVRPGSLVRSRLLGALDDALSRELTLVCTPAGFGKTTLLADWARRAKRPVAWLSLDRDDSDPIRFWHYVVAALDRPGAAGGRIPSSLLQDTGVSIDDLVTAVVNALESIADDVVLILDDYHVVGSAAVHESVASFLAHLPPPVHVVIASRSDPPLPLSRLRARNQLVELRAADLRFTPEESTAFLQDVWGLDVSPEAVAVLDSRTEGWAVGLQLVALSLRKHPDPKGFLEAFTGSHRYVLDYLSEEVLERQPEQIRTFLLQTSILERLTGQLCDAVTGGADGQDLLERLDRANLFLVPLDDERRWYRFHHLFGDLLRAQLHRTLGEGVRGLHRKAALWFERHRLIDEAIRHAMASADDDWAALLVEEHLSESLRRGEGAILGRWLSALPDDVVRSSPKLCLARAWMQLHIGHLDSAERLTDHAERAFADEEVSPGRELPTEGGMVAKPAAAVALLRADLAAARGDIQGLARWARLALTQMRPEEHGPRFLARFQLASVNWLNGRLAEAENAFGRLLAEGRTAPDAYPLLSSCFALGQVQAGRGRLSAALRTNREALRYATEGERLSAFHAGEAHIGMAQVLYQRDELEGALQHATAGIELCRHAVEFVLPAIGLVTLAWIRQAMGDPDAAVEAMDEARGIHPAHGFVALWNPTEAERARLMLVHGRIEEAERWADERGLIADDEVFFARERDHLVLARILLARREPARALHLLDRLGAQAKAQHRRQSLIEIRALRSLALQAIGERELALATLWEALSLAKPEGYIRVLVDEGPPMAALVQRVIRHRRGDGAGEAPPAARGHLLRVAQAFHTSTRSGHQTADVAARLVEPLTIRELQVLRFLAAGSRNREIATGLVVTLDTVKRHVSHIFHKLGATNRTEAVARARELHLIP